MLKKFYSTLAIVLLCSASTLQLEAVTLQEKFEQAQPGDYIVTAQDGNYSLLFLRAMNEKSFLLEEISVPSHLIDLKSVAWKNWLQSKAPGHTSWTLYEVDRASGELIECFSYSKNGWLLLDASEQFLTRLLTLNLSPVPEKERKKIGPQPAAGETDRRATWTPTLVFEGSKHPKPSYDILKTQWPDDHSRLALSTIELYFSKDRPAFPFPYWLEIKSPHYAFKMRAVDSGSGLRSPMSGAMPKRAPQISGNTHKGKESWKIPLRTPSYFQKFHLFAKEIGTESKETLPLPSALKKGEKMEEAALEISVSELKKRLTPGKSYRFVVVPEGSPELYIESEETFTHNL